jgi:signal transduction histidine kinase
MEAAPARLGTGDALFTGAFVAATTAEALWRDWGRPGWLAVGLGGAVVVAVVGVRRTHPLAALTAFVVAAAGATVVQAQLPDPTSRTTSAFVPIIAVLVLCYSVGAHARPRAMVLAAPQPVLLVVLVDLLQPSAGQAGAAVPFFTLVIVGLPMLAGWLVRSRSGLLAELHETERVLAEQHEERLRAVRARESIAVSERLAGDLEAGLLALHDRASALAEDPGHGPGELEESARALLALTRRTVVGLAADDPDPGAPRPLPAPAAVPEEVPEVGAAPADESTQAWTVLVGAAAGTGILLETRGDWSSVPLAILLCSVLVGGLALAWRRPVEGIATAWIGAALFDHLVASLTAGANLALSALVVCTPFLVAWLDRRARAAVGLVLCLAGAATCVEPGDLGFVVVCGGLAWVAGRVLRGRVLLLRRVRAAHGLLERERREQLRASVLEERAALARDVHDAIGHSLTVVALQAGAATRLAATDPGACADAVATIGRVTGQALDELRRGFGTSWDLTALLHDARAAGLDVRVRGSALPGPGDGRVLQRVVQESLTNAMRHAPGADVVVELEDEPEGTRVAVRNGPARGLPSGPGGGAGLRGMRARVTAAGGSLDWEHTAVGGFSVVARVPRTTDRELIG